jgi:hypothetical protein
VQTDDADRVQGIEQRLEALAAQMRETIERGPREEREALHAYAVSLVGERVTPTFEPIVDLAAEADALPAATGAGTNAATLIGYGALLLPAGGFLMLVLPPIGVTLALSAVVLIAAGIALAVFSRLRGMVA